MKIRRVAFNIYLCGLVCAGLLWAGCETTGGGKRGKEASTIRFHLETSPDSAGRTMKAPIFREKPQMVTVYRDPFLNEGDVAEAAVIEDRGSYVIKIQFNRHGAWMLENVTTSARGKRIAIQTQFGQSRWLGAPMITRRISNGAFVFTPDATREEAERIVRGLNNIAKELKKGQSIF